MAGQADGSIIVDTEINPEGFKAGSSELLAAIKSLSSEVKELGKILKETFSNNNRSIGGTDSSVQQLEATIASLKEEVQSLQSKVAELQERLNNLGNSKEPQTPVEGIATAAQNADGQIAALEAKIKGLESVIASLQTQLENATATPAEANIDISEAESKIAALETRIQELEAELSSAQSGQATPAPQADFSGPVQSASALQRSIDSVSNSVTNLEPTFQKAMSGSESAMTSFQTKAGELETKIATLREKLEAMGNTKTPTAEYKALSAETERAGVKLENLLNRQERMQAMGVKENSAQWKTLQYDLDLAAQKYDQLAAAKARMETSGTASTVGSQTAEYSQMVSQINAAESSLSSMQAQAARTEQRAHGIGAAFRRVGTAIGTAAKTVGGALLNGLKGVLSVTKKIIVGNKNYKKSFSGITSIIKRVGLGLLGCRGVYMILRKAVTAYMEANQGLANQLSSCWTSLGNLLGPLITKIINLVSTAIAYVTAFLKLLGITGSAASDAVEGSGGAAEKARKSLAAFDELNVLSNDKSDKGGNATAEASDLPEVSLPIWVETTIEKLKEAFSNGDYAGIGVIIGTKINEAIQKAKELISWENVGETITTFISNFAEAFNSLVSTVDWYALGDLLAEGFNTALNTLYLVLFEFDWPGLLAGLTESLNGFIGGIDWIKLGTTLSDGLKRALKTLHTAISTFDFAALGTGLAQGINSIDVAGAVSELASTISDLIKGILDFAISLTETLDWGAMGRALWDSIIGIIANTDWTGIVSKAFRFLGGAIGGSTKLIVEFCKELWKSLKAGFESTKSYFNKYIEEAGGNVVQGIWNGIVNALKNVGNWIVENIWNPFIEGFKNAFGIHSPSTKMAEMGNYIVEGLLNGIKNVWHTITDFFSGALDGIKNTISTAWTNIKNGASTAWTNIKSTLSTAWEGIKTTASTKWNNLKTTISTGWNNIKTGATTAWTNIKSSLSTAWDGIKTTASTKWNNLKTTISTGWNNIKSNASSTWDTIKSNLSSKWDSIKSTASTKWDNIKSTIKNKGWSSVGSNICEGISDGIEEGWAWLTEKVADIANDLLEAAKSALGIHSPSRLFRDAVGLNIGYGVGAGIEASQSYVLGSVTSIADAIAEEFNTGEYEANNIIPTTEVNGALSSFSDKISSSFTRLLDRLQAIAENVTFTTPAVANGIVPYCVTSNGSVGGNIVDNTIEASNDELASVVTQVVTNATAAIVAAIQQYAGATINFDKVDMTDVIIKEINRRTRMMGKSPLIA